MVFMMNAADERPVSSHSSALAPSGFLRSVQSTELNNALSVITAGGLQKGLIGILGELASFRTSCDGDVKGEEGRGQLVQRR
ncbi:hypothetical protein C356_06712 [Cryptococcus neoformans c45]|nr:hypothetical protein C356_06712 [Cryptococcus neoformans var. grubii c45]